MPELPEVETICAHLRLGTNEYPALVGKSIGSAQVIWEKTLASPDKNTFLFSLPGQHIEEINRRGKFLVFRLSNEYLLFHLRMSGDLIVERFDAPLAAHHRLVIDFTDGYRLSFNDPRKFGRAWLTTNPEEITGRLGMEPLSDAFTSDWLFENLLVRRRQLKPLLLDQSFIAGLGNIYTDEALNLAKVHPLTISSKVNYESAILLWSAIRNVLQEGIFHSGASIDWVYRGGDFQNYFRVYGRVGQPCPECGTLIERMVIGQRGSHYCPSCQKTDL